MISTGGDMGRCGKGEAAEKVGTAHVLAFGRDDNIGATVTRPGCCAIGYC